MSKGTRKRSKGGTSPLSSGGASISILKAAGFFAEDKDVAAKLRERHVLKAIRNSTTCILDFAGVDDATQSFIHALIAKPIRQNPECFFERVQFKDCTEPVRGIIEIVVEYCQLDVGEDVDPSELSNDPAE